MDTPVDLINDPLANAQLTKEQRQVWDLTRSELLIAREQIIELEARIKALEHASAEGAFVQTVLTRPEFNREVARMLAFDERYGGISSVVYIDIENLGEIHRQDGKQVSENVIRVICDTLAKHIRTSDILGRLGTDEFGLFLTRCENDAAWKKAETLATILANELKKIPGNSLTPVINFGAYTFHEKENVATGLKQAAETVTRSTQD